MCVLRCGAPRRAAHSHLGGRAQSACRCPAAACALAHVCALAARLRGAGVGGACCVERCAAPWAAAPGCWAAGTPLLLRQALAGARLRAAMCAATWHAARRAVRSPYARTQGCLPAGVKQWLCLLPAAWALAPEHCARTAVAQAGQPQLGLTRSACCEPWLGAAAGAPATWARVWQLYPEQWHRGLSVSRRIGRLPACAAAVPGGLRGVRQAAGG